MAQSFSSNHYPYNTMTLTGQGTVMVTPDLAVIRLGVQTTGFDLPQIQSENAQISQGILEALSKAGITDIKTIQYTIDKAYDYREGNQIDNGYTVRNILEIRTNRIEQTGSIIDMAVKMGANVVESVSFEIENPQLYYEQALNLAVDNAIQKAASIAENLQIRLTPVPIRIEESSLAPVPMQQFQREVTATPILPGEMRIEAMITADFLYS